MGSVSPRRALARAGCLALLAGPAAAQDLPRLDLSHLNLPKLAVPAEALRAPAARHRAEPHGRGLEACPAMGVGFVRLPGSRTCLRLSGRAAANLDLRAGRDGAAARPDAQGRFAVDARTETDLGPVRTYLRVGGGHR
jgi:hypothetical protein